MEDTFKEVTKLLKLLACILMIYSEAERSFSTWKSIKPCLRSTMCEDRLNALTVLSVEMHMIIYIIHDVVFLQYSCIINILKKSFGTFFL
jgi:hypothetical protein